MKKLFLLTVPFLLLQFSCSNPVGNGQPAKESQLVTEARQAGRLITGKVIGISDGDTFKLLAEGNKTIRVRLYGVDAPEKGQDYGTQARQRLSDLIFSKEVEVVQKNKDRYGRTVGIAFVNGTNVNEELLRSGMVWQYTDYDRSAAWARLQNEAKQSRLGLWEKDDPTPPWQWRKEKRKTRAVVETGEE